MALPCLFCPKPANTHEHIIPAWVAKEFGLRGAFLGATTEDARRARKQPISFKSHRKRFFCQECQTHFKALEDAVKPLIGPMGHRTPITLSLNEQRLIARWAAKTGFCLIASEPGTEDVVPEWQRYGLRQSDAPTDGVLVTYALYEGLAQKDVQAHLDEPSSDGKYAGRAHYSGFLSFASLAFKVFGVDEVRDSDRWDRYHGLVQFWPLGNEPISWPPVVGIRKRAIKTVQNLVPLNGYASPKD